MTNSEAAKCLEHIRFYMEGGECWTDAEFEAMDMAIEALRSATDINVATSKYTVSATAVEEMLKDLLPERGMWEIEGDEAKNAICETVHDALEGLWKLPFAQPEIIHCGDCKYKDDGIDEDGIPFLKCLNGRSYGGTRINDFCSWAERRTDDGE